MTNADVDVTILITAGRMHNETVHQNGNAERIAPVAVSGATGLLEAVLFLFLFCFNLQPGRLRTLFNVGCRLRELLRDWMMNRTFP